MPALSGSGLADLAAIGSMMIPAMKREGYRPEFAAAVLACAATTGPIIPPSIIAVIYGSVTGVSIGALFLGGAIPGVLAGRAMTVVTWYLAPGAGGRPTPRATLPAVGRATRHAMPACLADAAHHHRRHHVRRLHAHRGRCGGGPLCHPVRSI